MGTAGFVDAIMRVKTFIALDSTNHLLMRMTQVMLVTLNSTAMDLKPKLQGMRKVAIGHGASFHQHVSCQRRA